MKRLALVLGTLVFLGVIAAAIVPMWVATSDLALSGAGAVAVLFMILGCFALGGGLMFLIFYSARKGYDDEAHLSAGRRPRDELE